MSFFSLFFLPIIFARCARSVCTFLYHPLGIMSRKLKFNLVLKLVSPRSDFVSKKVPDRILKLNWGKFATSTPAFLLDFPHLIWHNLDASATGNPQSKLFRIKCNLNFENLRQVQEGRRRAGASSLSLSLSDAGQYRVNDLQTKLEKQTQAVGSICC